jgi:alpha-N-arabinofuranosidase
MTDLRKRNGKEDPWAVRFWGIGNESWGCGGMMTAEFYADNFRRYGVYARNYGSTNLYRIACGPNTDDYNWTKVLMEKVYDKGKGFMKGLTLHYYTVPGEWIKKGSATEFGEQEWFTTMKKASRMDELVHKHGAIMDQYDPRREVSLIVDEWGTWYDVEKDTNPGFLYQQNTLRDALVAAINLNIFNNYAERVRMANIAQTINVLQALILTRDEKIILTPTYHVFDMYKVHQDALRLPVTLESDTYSLEGQNLPALSASASIDGENRIHLSLCNIDPHAEQKIKVDLRDFGLQDFSELTALKITGQIISAENMQDHNTFDNGDRVKIADFNGFAVSSDGRTLNVPPKSVVTLEIGKQP